MVRTIERPGFAKRTVARRAIAGREVVEAEAASADLVTPVGRLRLEERGGALTRIAWAPGRHATDSKIVPSPLLREAMLQLRAYFAGKRRSFELPLAPAGTPFQRRVLEAMAEIPYGAFETYGELAERVGSGPRAIGGVCAVNPLPIVIPCHRVLAAGGRLGNYSGGSGIQTKLALLDLEGALML